MNGAEMIDRTDDSTLWLTTGEGEEVEDGSTPGQRGSSNMFLKVLKQGTD